MDLPGLPRVGHVPARHLDDAVDPVADGVRMNEQAPGRFLEAKTGC
jgi:hypothetical protein